MNGSVLEIALVIFCLLLVALASAVETSLTSINKIRVRHLAEEGHRRARTVATLLEHPHEFLHTVLIINSVAVIVASSVATRVAIDLSPGYGELIVTVVISLSVLIFCEIAPKTFALQNPERIAFMLGPPVRVASIFFSPIIKLLNRMTIFVIRILGGRNVPRDPFLTEDELRMMVNVSEEQGVIEQDEHQMINSIFELGDTVVREVMVPRIDITALPDDLDSTRTLDAVLEAGYSRIPVYHQTIDNIIGLLYTKDLLMTYVKASGQPFTIRELLRQPHFVPETKKVDELLHEMQQEKVHMAIVVDEYGGTAGLITIEDLLEEIVGEIQDEYDTEVPLLERIAPNEIVADARLSLNDVGEQFNLNLDGNAFDTLGGLVYSLLGRIPHVGDKLVVNNVTIEVIRTDGRRPRKLRLTSQEPQEVDDREAEAIVRKQGNGNGHS